MEKTFENSLKFQKLPNGETLAYRSRVTSLSKYNLILIHGWICSSYTIWDDLEALLSDLQLNIFALDLRGFGNSSYNKSIYSIEDLAEDVHLFVDALKLKNLVVGGYSLGGAVALAYASKYSEEIEKLISFNGVGCQGLKLFYEKDGQQVQIVKSEDLCKSDFWASVTCKWKNDLETGINLEAAYTYNEGKKIDSKRMEEYIKNGLFQERHVADAIYWLTHFNISNENNGVVDGNGKIQNIQCKCLFIHTENDLVLSIKEHAEYTSKIIGKEKAKIEIIKNSGHCASMSNPEKTAEVVRTFLFENNLN